MTLPAKLEQNLSLLKPQIADLVPKGLTADRLLRTIFVSLEQTPKLVECTHQSIMRSAITAAVLGLEVDGVSGQGYLIPFGGKAQFVPGYKGYNTMAARSGYSIDASVVREGDLFHMQKGTSPLLDHAVQLGAKGQRRIVGAYAVALHKERPPLISWLSIDDCLAIKRKAPGGDKSDSPWNDRDIGFPAMCEKSARRRLARGMPLNTMVWGAALEEAIEERGKPAYVTPDGPVINGVAEEVEPIAADKMMSDSEPNLEIEPPTFDVALADGTSRSFTNIDEWAAFMVRGISTVAPLEKLHAFWDRNKENLKLVAGKAPDTIKNLTATYRARERDLEGF